MIMMWALRKKSNIYMHIYMLVKTCMSDFKGSAQNNSNQSKRRTFNYKFTVTLPNRDKENFSALQNPHRA